MTTRKRIIDCMEGLNVKTFSCHCCVKQNFSRQICICYPKTAGSHKTNWLGFSALHSFCFVPSFVGSGKRKWQVDLTSSPYFLGNQRPKELSSPDNIVLYLRDGFLFLPHSYIIYIIEYVRVICGSKGFTS